MERLVLLVLGPERSDPYGDGREGRLVTKVDPTKSTERTLLLIYVLEPDN